MSRLQIMNRLQIKSPLQVILVAYTAMNPMLTENLKSVIAELDYCSYEQQGDEFHLTDLSGKILPALVENGLLSQAEADELISKNVSRLAFVE